MNIPEPAPSLAGHRVLVGPNDVAGVASRIAKALAASGAAVGFFNANDHAFNPEVASAGTLQRWFVRPVELASRWKRGGLPARVAGSLLARLVKAAAFFKACAWAQTLVIVGGKGFFLGGIEHAFLRLLGKRVVHVFTGTASRPRYLSGYARDVVRDGTINQKALRRLASRTRRQASRIRGISRHASVVIETPLCGHFHERPFINIFKLGIPLDVTALANRAQPAGIQLPATGVIRILHCPSRPEMKGSQRIQQTIAKLTREGLPIEFRQLTGVPHAQVLNELAACDLVVDQLYSDSPMAGFAAEAAALGKAAIVGGYGWDQFRTWLKPEEMPPTATCHPDDLEAVIRGLVSDPAARRDVGAQSRRFLQECWSERAFAERFTRIIRGDSIPADWWFRPQDVHYLHGVGLEEGETRRLIGALVGRFGTTSLQVDHLPGLRGELVTLAQKAPEPDSPRNREPAPLDTPPASPQPCDPT